MKTSEILNKSADIIEIRGWVQAGPDIDFDPWGTTYSTSPVCLEGGIAAVMGVDPLDHEFRTCDAYLAVKNYLLDAGRFPARKLKDYTARHVRLYHFNDAEGRTAEEVIEVLRAVAVIEEARERAEEKVEVPA